MERYSNILNNKLFKIVPIILGIMILHTSCDLFFKKELKQDRKLAYYRHKTHTIGDSIANNAERIKAFKILVAQASEDKHLITPHKKNKLLSEIYTSISAEYYDLFRIDEAIESCNLAIMLDVTNKYAYFNRGYLYDMISNDSLAIENYTKAIEIDDSYADAYYNRGMLYESNTDYQLAIEDYGRAIKQKPSYLADVYNNRGNTYQEMRFYDKAVNDYTAAIALDSIKAMSYYNRANTYIKQEKTYEALLDFNKVLHLDSTNLFVVDKIKSLEQRYTQGQQVAQQSQEGGL